MDKRFNYKIKGGKIHVAVDRAHQYACGIDVSYGKDKLTSLAPTCKRCLRKDSTLNATKLEREL